MPTLNNKVSSNKGNLNPGSNVGDSPIIEDIGTSDMNWGGKSPIEFIQFIIGDEIFSLFGDKMLNEAFESAFAEISEFILDDFILENLTESSAWNTSVQATYGGTGFFDNYPKRILKVVRQNGTDEDSDGSEQNYYTARKIINLDDQATNSHSIYYENDPFNPAWFVTSTGGINIIPKQSSSHPTGKVYYMSYPKFGIGNEIDSNQTHDLGDSSGIQNFSLVSSQDEEKIFYGLPTDARKGVYFSMALNLVFGYLNNFVQEDEDQELVNLLQSQSQSLLSEKSLQITFIKNKYGASSGNEMTNE
tara:strand:+ start:850 stop:1761 length:912 start_codon:yes stop_codon:yes gene_type:complete